MITAAIVKELRDKTNAGMMDCKKVLGETNGDIDAAIKLLRERGIMKAGTKTDRAAKAADLDAALAVQKGDLTVGDFVKSKVVEVGENIQFRKYVRFDAAPGGVVVSYIHLGGKVGVLLEVGTTNEGTASKDGFKELIKDLTLHIAAAAPKGLSREDIPQDVVDTETEIYRARLADSGKPANIIENILKGQIGKFFAESCFLEQGFVKDDKVTITKLLEEKGKELGDTITVTRFVRFGLGE